MLMIQRQYVEDLYLNPIPRIWAPSEFGDKWSVDQGEEQPAHHHGPPAHGYPDFLRRCLGLHE